VPGRAEPVGLPLKTLLSRRPCRRGESGVAAVAAKSIPDVGGVAAEESSPSAELGVGGVILNRLGLVGRPSLDDAVAPVFDRLL
jgi:hypothetical protein